MRIVQSTMSQEDNTTFQVGVKLKPKVPVKPSHLVNHLRKTASFDQQSIDSIRSSSETSFDKREMRKAGSFEDAASPPPTPVRKEQRRKSSHAILLTKPFVDVASSLHLRSPSTVSVDSGKDRYRDTIYEDGDYVQINFPQVEPGTRIRADGVSGKIEFLRSNTPPKLPPLRSISDESTRSNPNIYHHTALVQELQDNFRTNSLDSLPIPATKANETVDEGGYEVPLAFKMPTYMSFDSDFMSSSADETDAIEGTLRHNAVVNKHKKKRRLARFKRQETIVRNQPTSTLASNLSKNFTAKFPKNKPSAKEEATSQMPHDLPSDSNRAHPAAKTIPSFLSQRLKQSKAEGTLKHKAFSISTNNDYTTSSTLPYSSSDEENEWSDSSDCSSDCGDNCYYQQIDPPDLSGHASDHDYEVIEECLGYSRKHNKDYNRKKSMKSVMASVVSGRKRDKRTKSSESNKSPTDIGVSPKLQRKNMQDMRSISAANCTWETVSTPGILKLNDFKDFGKNKLSNRVIAAQAR